MRVAAKLTAALTVVFLVAFAVQTVFALRRTTAIHENELRDDLAIAARALGNGTGRIWALEGDAAARAFVAEADERRARTRIRLVDASEASAPRNPSHTDVVREASLLRLTIPVFAGDAPVAALQLERRVATEREALLDIIALQVSVALGLVLACSILALWLGIRLIGRPVESLVAQARAIAKGSYEESPADRRRDELGRLATEMNLMAAQLAEADRAVHRARRNTTSWQQRLRHADRLSTLGKLASTIAHELGTPLNVVSGRAGMIVANEDASDKVKKNARVIADQARSMADIIQQILDFARRRGLERKNCNVGTIVDEAISLLEPLAEEHDVTLQRDGDADVEAMLDEQKVLQVLTNLMMNGIQAMPDGGTVTLGVTEEHVDQPPDARCEPGSYVRIDVVDEGVGMAPDRLERIFEPFYTTKAEGEGTGLGLDVCQGIMREHGGFMKVESEVGTGSRFSMFLPREDT